MPVYIGKSAHLRCSIKSAQSLERLVSRSGQVDDGIRLYGSVSSPRTAMNAVEGASVSALRLQVSDMQTR